MSFQQTFKVVYNGCYGGFDLSTEGLKEYNIRTSQNVTIPDYIDRDDSTLIEMVETMDNKEINSKNSKLKIKEFPIKFKMFLLWSEYDGNESIRIDYNKYIVHNVEIILHTNISVDEKIKSISKLYTELDEIKCHKCNEYVCMHITPIKK